MPQIALHTLLKHDAGPAYDAVHQTIPGAVADLLREHGVHDWRIWRDAEHVFHLVDVTDYAAMRAALRDHPDNLAWQATVGPLFEVADLYDPAHAGIPLLWSLSEQLKRKA